MKKKKKSMIRRGFSRIKTLLFKIFKIREWFDWDRVKSFTLYLRNTIKSLVTPQRETKAETFKSTVTHFKIPEEELLIKQNALFRLSLVMVGFAAFILIYAAYQLMYGTYRATIVSLVLMGIALVLAFRYHFWYFQIKRKQLGCTFEDWWNALRGRK